MVRQKVEIRNKLTGLKKIKKKCSYPLKIQRKKKKNRMRQKKKRKGNLE